MQLLEISESETPLLLEYVEQVKDQALQPMMVKRTVNESGKAKVVTIQRRVFKNPIEMVMPALSQNFKDKGYHFPQV